MVGEAANKFYLLTMTDYDGDISYYHLPQEWYEWVVSYNGPNAQSLPIPDEVKVAYLEYCGKAFPEKWDLYHVAAAAEEYAFGSKAADLVAAVPQGAEVIEIKGEWY